jgi:hypothetical protein
MHSHEPQPPPSIGTHFSHVAASRGVEAKVSQSTVVGDDLLCQKIGLGEVGALELLPNGIVHGMLYAAMH